MESYWHYQFICPFYKWDRKQKICCEDGFQIAFDSKTDAKRYLNNYCASWDYVKCPHARHMNDKYEGEHKNGKKSFN